MAKILVLGADEMVGVNDLAHLVAGVAVKRGSLRRVPGPQGVRSRRSDHTLICGAQDRAPQQPLRAGLAPTCRRIVEQVARGAGDHA